ncbi:MAG: selenide, water dikinase SelD [Peptococcia bacterium]
MSEYNDKGIQLTSLTSECGGAAKIGQGELLQVLGNLPKSNNPQLMVGIETSDDAGVFLLNEETALIQTVDFFTPIADDPYIFGAIAAANALSDIYAMGGRPILAMNIMAFPLNELPYQVLADILRGGADKVIEAGAVLVGGHSIKDKEPKYGLSVTGIAHPSEIWTNAGAKPGDVLIITKPLGVGIITAALKKKGSQESDMTEEVIIPPEVEQKAFEVMLELNARGAITAKSFQVHACTDITGFGLLGHGWEIANNSGVTLEFWSGKIPVIEGTRDLAVQGYISEGNYDNLKYLEDKVYFDPQVGTIERHIMADPIISGGLLLAVPEDEAEELLNRLLKANITNAAIIGRVLEGEPRIKVLP